MRSLDGLPLERSRRFRVYHGFGPDALALSVDAARIRVNGVELPVSHGRVTIHVPREAVVELVGSSLGGAATTAAQR